MARAPNWRLDKPTQAQRDILHTDMVLTLKGETPEEIAEAYKAARKSLGWHDCKADGHHWTGSPLACKHCKTVFRNSNREHYP